MKISLLRPLFLAALTFLAGIHPVPLTAQGRHPTKPTAISQEMQRFVDDGVIAGAVTLVGRHDRILSVDAVGFSDLSARKAMRADDLFWIASMTKPVTALAVLMLQDEGKLNVEDPVEKYLPEFKNQWLLSESARDRRTLVPAPRPITLRDLLTHTAGLGDVPAPRPDASLAELVIAYSQQPLRFPPGSKWEYSNPGINTLGRIVEVVSGEKYADFLRHRILQPLGMKNTTFWPTAAQARRLAKSYKPAEGGKGLTETDIYFIKGALGDRHRTAIPAGGLFSTAADIGRFYQMTLSGGTFGGKKISSPETLALMTRTQSGQTKTGFTDGMSWGFGFQVVREPQGVTGMLSPGTYGHGGAYATQSWADPKKDLVLVLMIQRAGFKNGDDSPVRKAFQETAVAVAAH